MTGKYIKKYDTVLYIMAMTDTPTYLWVKGVPICISTAKYLILCQDRQIIYFLQAVDKTGWRLGVEDLRNFKIFIW